MNDPLPPTQPKRFAGSGIGFRTTTAIRELIELLFPEEVEERRALLLAEQQQLTQEALPLFVCSLVCHLCFSVCFCVFLCVSVCTCVCVCVRVCLSCYVLLIDRSIGRPVGPCTHLDNQPGTARHVVLLSHL